MINHLHLESFKCFSSYDVEFKQIQLLIGGNNSGKTTIFQALQVFFWCLEQTAEVTETSVNLKKTQLPEIVKKGVSR
jgi:predicted ATP-dependent endonuclease of OLD family